MAITWYAKNRECSPGPGLDVSPWHVASTVPPTCRGFLSIAFQRSGWSNVNDEQSNLAINPGGRVAIAYEWSKGWGSQAPWSNTIVVWSGMMSDHGKWVVKEGDGTCIMSGHAKSVDIQRQWSRPLSGHTCWIIRVLSGQGEGVVKAGEYSRAHRWSSEVSKHRIWIAHRISAGGVL